MEEKLKEIIERFNEDEIERDDLEWLIEVVVKQQEDIERLELDVKAAHHMIQELQYREN